MASHSSPPCDTAKADDDAKEREHFRSICSVYRQYGTFAMAQRRGEEARLAEALASSPPSSQSLLNNNNNNNMAALVPPTLQAGSPEHTQRATAFQRAAVRNQFFFDCVLQHHGQPHSQQATSLGTGQQDEVVVATSDEQISKLSSVLKSLVRDWSAEGQMERDQAYTPLLKYVQTYLPLSLSPILDDDDDDDNEVQRKTNCAGPPKICVTGSGLGRLAFELCRLGYQVQGNDFSLYMLLVSDFMLNNGGRFTPERPLTISPWLMESRNVHTFEDRIRTVTVPDVDPMTLLLTAGSENNGRDDDGPPEFSVAAGDFTSIYNHPKEAGQWDAVISCFFLDACPNVVEVLGVVHKMLRPGGLLVNLGPLLFHWSGPPFRPDDGSIDDYKKRYAHLDDRYLTSIDVPWEDVRQILINMEFEFLVEETGIECFYAADPRSMMRTTYQCISFVARKQGSSSTG